MIKGSGVELSELSESLYITDELYSSWQNESKSVGIHDSVVDAIKNIRKSLAALEKEDGNKLRYYISDRRWRKAFRLMQTSAYLNGRRDINLSDYLLLVHSFWNEVECIPNIINAITSSISDITVRQLNKIDKLIRQAMTTQSQRPQPSPFGLNIEHNNFAEYDYFYYLVENYPGGEVYFSKWDYTSLNSNPRDGIMFFEAKKKKNVIHALIPGKPFDSTANNVANLKKVRLQKCPNGVIIDGTPYAFRTKGDQQQASQVSFDNLPIYQRIPLIQDLFKTCVEEWEKSVASNWTDCDNIFLSPNDLALVNKMLKEVTEQIKTIEVKLNNVVMMIK
nr:hypothetical protein [Xylanibacter rodentium]